MWSAKTGIFVCLFVFLRKLQNTGEMTPTFTYLFSDYCSAVLIHLVWLIANVHTLIPLCPQKRIAIITHCHNLSLLLRGVSYAAAASYPYVSPWSLALRHQSLACHSRVTCVSRSPLRLRRRRLMHQDLVTRDCFWPNGSWSQREFSSNPNTNFFLNNTSSKNMTNLHHWRK